MKINDWLAAYASYSITYSNIFLKDFYDGKLKITVFEKTSCRTNIFLTFREMIPSFLQDKKGDIQQNNPRCFDNWRKIKTLTSNADGLAT